MSAKVVPSPRNSPERTVNVGSAQALIGLAPADRIAGSLVGYTFSHTPRAKSCLYDATVAAHSAREVVIVGAGIAGLTAAIALDRVGASVTVVERATALTQAGTALSIWPNALAALDRVDLRAAMADIGWTEPAPVARNASGRLLLAFQQDRLGTDPDSQALIVRRSDLQHLLLHAASHLPIRLQTAAERIVTKPDGAEVGLADGSVLNADLVLACDGIHSIARPLFSNPPLAYRNRTSWRAVIESAAELVPSATLTIGNGNQFVASRLRDGSAYWAADVGLAAGANAALTDRRGFLLSVFSSWHDPIPQLIGATDHEQMVIADFYDSIPRRLVKGRVALLGDAGHPMTPDLGQGACQGIEDAIVLAECMRLFSDLDDALRHYESSRLRRVRRVVRGSRRLGRLATVRSTKVSYVRDLVARYLPASVNARIIASVASERAFTRTMPTS